MAWGGHDPLKTNNCFTMYQHNVLVTETIKQGDRKGFWEGFSWQGTTDVERCFLTKV